MRLASVLMELTRDKQVLDVALAGLLALARLGQAMIQPEVGWSCKSKMRRLMGEGRKPIRR